MTYNMNMPYIVHSIWCQAHKQLLTICIWIYTDIYRQIIINIYKTATYTVFIIAIYNEIYMHFSVQCFFIRCFTYPNIYIISSNTGHRRPQAHWRKSREAEDIGGSRRVGVPFGRHSRKAPPIGSAGFLRHAHEETGPRQPYTDDNLGFGILDECWYLYLVFRTMKLRILSLGSRNLHPCYIGWLLFFYRISKNLRATSVGA